MPVPPRKSVGPGVPNTDLGSSPKTDRDRGGERLPRIADELDAARDTIGGGGERRAAAEREDEDVNMEGGEESGRESGREAGHGPTSASHPPNPRKRSHNGWTDNNRSASRSPRVGATFPGGVPPGLELLPNGMAVAAALLSSSGAYMRPGSNVPSRTHSPLGPGAAIPPGYMLPPHALAGGPYYPGAPTGDLSSLMNLGMAAGVALNNMGPPTVADLERHYIELAEHKKRWEEMMERTERLMAGVKRTIDEMKGTSTSSQPVAGPKQPEVTVTPAAVEGAVGVSETAAPAASVPLATRSGERKEPVWPLADPIPAPEMV
ncbi:hypothetical protein NMY22_g17826 [Coprinellus aureogranulatus]|nr:hypothetical protein NMY22_g17826 [Coprinellus aureogranulatus]